MSESVRPYISRTYWSKYIDIILESIKADKDSIIDMMMYGSMEGAKITMNISVEKAPTYTFEIKKIGENSPFVENNDE